MTTQNLKLDQVTNVLFHGIRTRFLNKKEYASFSFKSGMIVLSFDDVGFGEDHRTIDLYSDQQFKACINLTDQQFESFSKFYSESLDSVGWSL